MNNKNLVIICAAVICFITSNINGVTWQDGIVHNVDYTLDEWVTVNDNLSGNYTSVNLLQNGYINFLLAYDKTRFNMSGGTIDTIESHNNSYIEINSGTLQTGLITYEDSTGLISGGSFGLGFFANNNSMFDIKGGSFGVWLVARDNSELNISGGLMPEFVRTEYGRINISGGNFNNFCELGADGGQITIMGNNFKIDGQAVDYGSININSGTLTGTLKNGDSINVPFWIGSEESSIILIPEPATLAFFTLGSLILKKRKLEK